MFFLLSNHFNKELNIDSLQLIVFFLKLYLGDN